MSKATFELGELICQHLTLRYSPHGKRALAKLAKEMGSTVEQIVATSLVRRIEKRFDLTPKAEGSPSALGDSPAEQPFRR
jgi:hypothetical protein